MYYRRMWSTGINRNIVECKVRLLAPSSGRSNVLIETLWNVKTERGSQVRNSDGVLIETLWNVKITATTVFGNGQVGINRNIVECKVGITVAAFVAYMQY